MIHREGWPTILISFVAGALLIFLANRFLPVLSPLAILAALFLWVIVLQFFRNPARPIPAKDDKGIYAPADGKVVVIEEIEEPEYFKGKRLQVSIFMSPLNVHVNRNPVSGVVRFYRYHRGAKMPAWEPKASIENERTTVVYQRTDGVEILTRQIAGAMARRIVNYLKEGQSVEQGCEMAFIKFGSRVDVYLPLDAQVTVQLGQKVKGNTDIIARCH